MMADSDKIKNQDWVTLKEMARYLNRCERTLRKYVAEYDIPHIRLGRDLLFNRLEVENFLKTKTVSEIKKESLKEPKKKFKPELKLPYKYKENRFASLLKLG